MFSHDRHYPKWLRAVQKRESESGLLESVVLVRGRAPFSWTNAGIAWLVGFVTVFVVLLALGYLFVPGGVAAVLAYNSTKPVHFVTVAPDGARVWRASLWNASPKALVSTQPLDAIHRVDDKTSLVGPTSVQLSSSDHELIRGTAAHQLQVTSAHLAR